MGNISELGKQQLKSLRARESICDATIQSLIDNGYGETSLNRVAALANFSKGALQHHFPTKEDLMVATADRLLERPFSLPSRKMATAKNVDDYLMTQWKKLVNTPSYWALLEILVASRTDRKLQDRIADNLLSWNEALDQQALGAFKAKSGKEEDVRVLMTMTRSLMRGLVIQDQYGADDGETLSYIRKWIELVSPLLELKQIS